MKEPKRKELETRAALGPRPKASPLPRRLTVEPRRFFTRSRVAPPTRDSR